MNKLSLNSASFTLNSSQLAQWRSEFYSLPLNRLAQNICTTCDPISACLRQDAKTNISVAGKERYTVADVVKPTVGGPNWICCGLDLLRLAMSKECELSVPYLFYWHKLERCNYFLCSVVILLAQCEPLNGRTFQYLMKHAVPDGGNWQMFVNLVHKYGVMPKKCFVATWSASRTLHLNRMLQSKLREFSSQLHAQFTFDGDASQLPTMVKHMVEELYKIINICLGTPPEEFYWSLKDEEDEGNQSFTPLSFYQSIMVPQYALECQICLGHDPRLLSSYHRNYRVAYSSNMIHGAPQSYNNQPMETLLQIMVNSLAAGSAVWLVCDLQPRFNSKSEVLSLNTHNFEHVFSMPVGSVLNKAERMIYKDTRRNTVLLLTEVTVDAKQQPLQFRTISKTTEAASKASSTVSLQDTAESEQGGPKRKVRIGTATVLNVDWLREYGFEIVVDSRFIPQGVMHALKTQPIVELPIWDPMGALLS